MFFSVFQYLGEKCYAFFACCKVNMIRCKIPMPLVVDAEFTVLFLSEFKRQHIYSFTSLGLFLLPFGLPLLFSVAISLVVWGIIVCFSFLGDTVK